MGFPRVLHSAAYSDSAAFASLSELLSKARNGFEQESDRGVHVVIGNEAGDLDSMVSALVYSISLRSGHYAENPSEKFTVVPVLNFNREDLALRPEAVALLELVGIDAKSLFFLDDAQIVNVLSTLGEASTRQKHRVSLVDHNRIAVDQAQKFTPHVWSIIDHHIDEGLRQGELHDNRRIIRPVGSCSTLVYSQLAPSTDSPLANDPLCALLTCATILLDTGNCDPQQKKATEADMACLEAVCGVLKLSKEDRDLFYERLVALRSDVSNLTTEQLLRKDVKFGTVPLALVSESKMSESCPAPGVNFAISTVPLSLEAWASRDQDLLSNMEKFRSARNLDLVCAMTAFMERNTFKRQFMAFAAPDSQSRRVPNLLQIVHRGVSNNQDLKFQEITNSLFSTRRSFKVAAFSQGNVALSRKKILPTLVSILSKI